MIWQSFSRAIRDKRDIPSNAKLLFKLTTIIIVIDAPNFSYRSLVLPLRFKIAVSISRFAGKKLNPGDTYGIN